MLTIKHTSQRTKNCQAATRGTYIVETGNKRNESIVVFTHDVETYDGWPLVKYQEVDRGDRKRLMVQYC